MAETAKIDEMIGAIESMSVLELVELSKALQDKFGVSAAAPVAAAAAAGPAAEAEEQTEFTVQLTAYGDKKIQVIKVVRAITALGLKEAKELVESCPKAIKEDLTKEEAEKIKKEIEDVGGAVSIE